MKQAIIVVVCLGLALGSASCAAPVALGAAVVGAGAQAGWWFGKSSKQDAQAKEKQEKKEAPHVGAKSQ